MGLIQTKLGQHTQLSTDNISTKFGRIPSRRRKWIFFRIHDHQAGEISWTDFSTGFSLITRESYILQVWKMSQKISFVILRRMVYKFRAKHCYLKSENDEVGRFCAIWGFFSISPDFDATNGGMAQCLCPRLWEGLNA